MKKRILTIALAAIMMISLVACGGVDKKATVEAFNTANTKLTEISTLANANLAVLDQDTIALLTKLAETMAVYKEEIEGDKITQERANEVTELLKALPAELDTLKATMEKMIADGGNADTDAGGITEEQKAALTQISADMLDLYNKYKELYDGFDDNTKKLVDDLSLSIADIETVLNTEGATSEQTAPVIEAFQQQLEAAQTSWTEIEAQIAG